MSDDIPTRRILVLDDDPSRARAFKKNLVGRGRLVTWVETAYEAIAALRGEEPFHAVFLDHDLDRCGKHKDLSGSGTDVVDCLLEHPELVARVPLWVVHSLNSQDGGRMAANLDQLVKHHGFDCHVCQAQFCWFEPNQMVELGLLDPDETDGLPIEDLL